MPPARTKTSINLPSDLIQQIKFLAVAQNREFSDLHEEALRDLIEKYKFKVNYQIATPARKDPER